MVDDPVDLIRRLTLKNVTSLIRNSFKKHSINESQSGEIDSSAWGLGEYLCITLSTYLLKVKGFYEGNKILLGDFFQIL